MYFMYRKHQQFTHLQVAIGVSILLLLFVSFIQLRNSQRLQPVSAAGESILTYEAESAQHTAPLSIATNDSSASNNAYVIFGNTNNPTPTLPGGSATYPAQVLNLTPWKITLPIDGSDNDSEADQVKQPVLATYSNPNYFFVSPAGNSVIFRAHAGGATTSGSDYARSELREMTANGSTEIGWSSATGKHTMLIDQRVNKLPTQRPNIIVGQVHAGTTWGTVFRLIGTQLMIDGVDGDGPIVDNNLQLGERFTVKFEVENDTVKYYYNNVLVNYTYKKQFRNAYFKAGSYIQSSCTGAKKVPGESCDAYGEVELFDVQVTHN